MDPGDEIKVHLIFDASSNDHTIKDWSVTAWGEQHAPDVNSLDGFVSDSLPFFGVI